MGIKNAQNKAWVMSLAGRGDLDGLKPALFSHPG